jgi:ABC-type glutathione transport system ATPase component
MMNLHESTTPAPQGQNPSGDGRAPEAIRPPEAILALENVAKTFTNLAGHPVQALKPTSLTVRRGEIVAVVGESGSGKSTLARVALGVITPDQGRVEVFGKDWASLSRKDKQAMRAAIQPVFQDPTTSLNPRRSIRNLLKQASWAHKGDQTALAIEVLGSVGLRPEVDFLDRYPHQLSGGQRQRLAIARALAMQPSVIIADEPLSGADVSIRGQILNLLLEIRKTRNVSYLMITHDISIARYFADRVAVMKTGEIVEEGPAEDVIANPKNEYTRKLLASVMKFERKPKEAA